MSFLQFFVNELPPLHHDFVLSRTARLPSLRVQLLDKDTPVDLTGGTITFSMKNASGTNVISGAAASLVDATLGQISYAWAVSNVATSGTFFGVFDAAVASSSYRIPDNLNQRLRIRIGPTIP